MAMREGKENNPTKIIWGLLLSILVALLLTGCVSYLIVNGRVGEQFLGFLAMVIVLLAVLAGWLLNGINNKKAQLISLTGVMVVILCCSFTIRGPFVGVIEILITIVCSGLISCIICMKLRGRNRKRKIHNR